ncbi:fimbrillin family protein [Bacteroides reticulotermitis]|uniref:fimbrillin family protein n=1 Tax=Bacteroides reticulotermitis TaxID=1133319 RepID=UPI003A84DDB8
MRTKILTIGMVAMMGLASCSKNEEVRVPKQDGMIEFNVTSNKAIVRAPVESSSGMQGKSFNVWAYETDDPTKQFIGESNNPLAVTYDATTSLWKLTIDKYWPADVDKKFDFYAIWPSDQYHNNTSIIGSAQTLAYAQSVYLDAGTEINDLMYAIVKGKSKATATGNKVMLYFKHALSQVKFKGKIAQRNPQLKVSIKSLEIRNLKSSGNFSFPSVTTGAGSAQGAWGSHGGKRNFGGSLAANVEVQDLTNAVDIGTPFLLVPQVFTPWSTTAGAPVNIAQADLNGEVYLKMEVHITQNGEDLLGTTGSYAMTYVPLPNPTSDNGFVPGKKYLYTLKFGGGKKDDGTDQLAPITFEVDVEEWGDPNEGDVEL